MEYRKFDNQVVARIDKGKEIQEQLKLIALTENISLANVNALGAVGAFTVGVFKVEEKKYCANEFKGNYDIVSLTGTITTEDGEYYSHLHMSAGDVEGKVLGGHLNTAIIVSVSERQQAEMQQ